MQLATEQIIVDILKTELELGVKNVFVQNQNINIPNDKQLYISVGMVDTIIMNHTNAVEKNGDTNIKTVQQVQARENIQIDIMSSSNLALLKRAEVLMALNSVYAEQKQEEYQFKIFQIPQSFVNSSSAEGGSQINRFTIVIACFVWYKKITNYSDISGDYYDNFETRVDDSKTIDDTNGLIEFEIP